MTNNMCNWDQSPSLETKMGNNQNIKMSPFKSSENIQKHYENMPMQYTAIFHGCKIDNFQMQKIGIFLIFAQNIDCWYTLEPPQ